MLRKIVLLAFLLSTFALTAQRKFVHPGIGYTQADIDRMRAMVNARQEPFYSSFLKMKADTYSSLSRSARNWSGSLDRDGYPIVNNISSTVGFDGRCAAQYALIWKITDDKMYADKAVSFLNAYKKVRNVSSTGTAPLDNGKIYMLCVAAELMRDYSGWKPADQQAFRDMLVYPGYSSKINMSKQICSETGVTYAYYDSQHKDTLNRVSFYWNIFNGDPGRHGNQGLFALRGLMAMGIYLDNDTIYDRALRKFLSLPHRLDDLPYSSGPPVQSGRNTSSSTEWFDTYNIVSVAGTGPIEDYGYNDELKYYIFENGQMQESSRDQNHAVCGIVMVADIAHLAWAQGDDLYTPYDNRLLKGINWTWKYNYSWYNNVLASPYWPDEPTWEPTVESGEFMVRPDRSGRWRSLKVNPYSESPSTDPTTGEKYWKWSRGEKAQLQTQMLMQYKVRQGLVGDSILWLQRAYDSMMEALGYENGYKDTGHYYEFLGWGGLLDYRSVWMAGDGGRFVDGQFVPGLPSIPCSIKAVDYDFYNRGLSGEGHTYHNGGTRSETNYRLEGGMDITADSGDYVLDRLMDGEWVNYTIINAVNGWYQVTVDAMVDDEGVSLGMAVDNGTQVTTVLPLTKGYENLVLGKIRLPAGAIVLRLYVHGTDNRLKIKGLQIEPTTPDTSVQDYVWNSRDYRPVSGSGCFMTDKSDKLLTSSVYANATTPTFTVAMDPNAYRVDTKKQYLVIHGRNLEHALFRNAIYRLPGGTADVERTSTGGQVPTWAHTGLGSGMNESILVWKVDSSSNSRIVPLLKPCYSGGFSDYILKKLSFLVYGSNLHRNTEIDDIGFYSLTELLTAYPELNGTPVALKAVKSDSENLNKKVLYDISGRVIHILNGEDEPEAVLNSLPKGIYIIGRRKICN